MSASQPTPIHIGHEFAAAAAAAVSDAGFSGNDLKPGARSADSQYTLGTMIARGGMGVVFEARHRDLGRSVALKIVRGAHLANSHELGRFKAETEAAARLDHPNIVPIYDVGEMYGQPYFTMKLIEGGSLAQRLKDGPVPVREAVQMMAKVARAVQHAHERGVLHRDLKPGNILLDAHGEPFLTDFGLAKFAGTDKSLTVTGEVVGTPEFMAPEQTRGDELTMSCDVWALGVVLYQTLSGRMPFTGSNPIEIIKCIAQSEPAPLTGSMRTAVLKTGAGGKGSIDRDLATIVGRCLEKDSARRMVSAGFLADELERWLAGEPIRSRHVTQAERVMKWVRRHPGTVAAVAVVLISVIIGSISSFVLWRKADSANEALSYSNGQLGSVNDTLKATNTELARSLRHATATRLASEARVALGTDASLGLALAVESAETMRRESEPPLPSTVSTLLHGLSLIGGADYTASRGYPDTDQGTVNHLGIFSNFQCMGTRPVTSPDGRWFVTADFSQTGLFIALYEEGLPLKKRPVRRFAVAGRKYVDPGFFAYWWSPDSQELIVIDAKSREARAWDVLRGIENGPLPEDDLTPPPFRVLAKYPEPGGSVHFVKDVHELPIAIIQTIPTTDEGYPLFWQPIDLISDTGLGKKARGTPAMFSEPERITRGISPARRTGFIDSGSGTWLLNYDLFGPDAPCLLRLSNPTTVIPTFTILDRTDSRLCCAVFSPGDRWLLISTDDGTLRIHDLAPPDGDKARTISGRTIGRGFRMEMSADGKWLAAAVEDSIIELTPFDENGPVLAGRFRYRIGGNGLSQVAFSPDGKWIAVAGSDSVVWANALDRIKRGAPALQYRGLNGGVRRLQFSRDGKILTASTLAGETRRWEFNGSPPGTLPAVSRDLGIPPCLLAASPDGRWLVTAGGFSVPGEGPIVIYDTRTGKNHELPNHERPNAAAFSSNGRWLATSGVDSVLRWWDWPELAAALENGTAIPAGLAMRVEGADKPETHHLAIHPGGRMYCTFFGGGLYEWDLLAPDTVASMRHHHFHSINYMFSDAVISPDGKWLALGRHGNDPKPRPGSTQHGNMVLLIDCSDLDHLELVHELPANFRHVGRIRFSPDGRWLAATGQESPARIWDLQAHEIIASAIDSPFQMVSLGGVAFSVPAADSENSADSPFLACVDSTGTINLWDWQKGPAAVRRVDTGSPCLTAVCLAGNRLITGHNDNRLRTWETDPARLIELARQSAGRDLTPEERARFLTATPQRTPDSISSR